MAIVGKPLFQDTGTRLGRDITPDIAVKWLAWTSELHLLSDVHVPRWIGAQTRDLQDCEVHVFGDASERAYGAVIYLRSIVDDAFTIQLISSKGRLAPIKRVTLPRLELLAALVATRLLRYFCQASNCDISKATLWSDSAITLAWIRGDPNRWQTFVWTASRRYWNARHHLSGDTALDQITQQIFSPEAFTRTICAPPRHGGTVPCGFVKPQTTGLKTFIPNTHSFQRNGACPPKL